MLDRRRFATFLATLLVGSRGATAAPKSPTIWRGNYSDAPSRGAVRLRHPQTRYAMLAAKVSPKSVSLYSRSNDNQTFWFVVSLGKLRDGEWIFLELDGVYLMADSTGGDQTGASAWFTLDRASAERAATLFKTPLLERTDLDDGLRYRWSFPSTVALGSTTPIPVTLHVENAGKTIVGFMIGGRQRGPRDNRFSYTATRDGAAVAIKVAHDFGGPGYYKALKPGEQVEVTCADLREWIAFDQPGTYAIAAAFEGELSKDGAMPQTPAERVHLWDVRPTGQATIVVK